MPSKQPAHSTESARGATIKPRCSAALVSRGFKPATLGNVGEGPQKLAATMESKTFLRALLTDSGRGRERGETLSRPLMSVPLYKRDEQAALGCV